MEVSRQEYWSGLPFPSPRLLEGTNKTLCASEPKGAVTPKEIDSDWPVSVHKSLVEMWVDSGLMQGWGY